MNRNEYKSCFTEPYAPHAAAKAAWRRNPSPATQWAAAAAFEVLSRKQSALFAQCCGNG